MKYLSVCSGIEAASQAWAPLGWTPVAFSEIEPFPCAALTHHYPDTPNWGDMNNFKEWPDADVDVLCGGTPCQSFSNAGLRKGLDDPRGNLMLTFAAIAAKYRPRFLVWENVPGVLSSGGGRDFASFLGLLTGRSIEPPKGGWQSAGIVPGIADAYGLAWRTLDAQFVRVDSHPRAVPQRRNRVFVVGHLGDWRRAAAVLLERESLRGDPAPRREAGARVAACLTRGAESSGKGGYAGRRQEDDVNIVAGAAFGISPDCFDRDGEGANGTAGERSDPGDPCYTLQRNHSHAVCTIPFDTTQITSAANRSNPKAGDPCHPLAAHAHAPAIAFDARQSDVIQYGEKTGPLDTCGFTMGVQQRAAVRRLTPLECERLQGFPDSHTAITHRGKPAADGPRYKSIGNSWAVNVAAWVGRRIQIVDEIKNG